MFKINDKVIMLRNDGQAEKEWIGLVKWVGPKQIGRNIEVGWDNGKRFYHSYSHLAPKKSFGMHDLVVLLHNDGLARKGWKGVVVALDHFGVEVKWDVGGTFWHLYESITLYNKIGADPNLLFERKGGNNHG